MLGNIVLIMVNHIAPYPKTIFNEISNRFRFILYVNNTQFEKVSFYGRADCEGYGMNDKFAQIQCDGRIKIGHTEWRFQL